jgi:hypothetical protein
MNNIQPKYSTFEQAKWLKEIGFNEKCETSYYTHYEKLMIENNGATKITPMHNYSRPEQWQVVEWLRVNHGIWIEASLIKDFTYTPLKIFWYGRIINLNKEEDDIHNTEEFNTPQEAYSAAFDYIKENNLI